MTISQFVTTVTTKFGGRFESNDGRLRVRGLNKLPEWTRLAVAAHRQAIAAFIDARQDGDMKPSRTRAELRRLGFIQMVETGRWVHPDGDHVGDQILLGLIPPDAVGQDAAFSRPPPVKHLRETHPARSRWSEPAGARDQAPFP